MPQVQHRAQHHIHLPAGQITQLPAIEQKVDELSVYLQGLSPGVPVQRAEIVLPGILVINIEQLMVFFQYMRNFGRTVRKLFCRISCIAIDKRDGVKESEIGLALRFHALLRLAPAAAQDGCEAQGAAEGDDPLNSIQTAILR